MHSKFVAGGTKMSDQALESGLVGLNSLLANHGNSNSWLSVSPMTTTLVDGGDMQEEAVQVQLMWAVMCLRQHQHGSDLSWG
jgi:hypothetical protein